MSAACEIVDIDLGVRRRKDRRSRVGLAPLDRCLPNSCEFGEVQTHRVLLGAGEF
jgi:hypothetical protein